MSDHEQCGAVYDRILPGDKSPTHIRCTYVEGHTASHSWATLQFCDEAAAQDERERVREGLADTDLPTAVRRVVEGLTAGELDKYIELILAAGHDRKRARRGVYGFPRKDTA